MVHAAPAARPDPDTSPVRILAPVRPVEGAPGRLAPLDGGRPGPGARKAIRSRNRNVPASITGA